MAAVSLLYHLLCVYIVYVYTEQRKDEDYDDVVEENLLNEVWIITVY